ERAGGVGDDATFWSLEEAAHVDPGRTHGLRGRVVAGGGRGGAAAGGGAAGAAGRAAAVRGVGAGAGALPGRAVQPGGVGAGAAPAGRAGRERAGRLGERAG